MSNINKHTNNNNKYNKYINNAAEKAEKYLKSLYIYDDSSIKDFYFNIGT